MWVGCWCCEVLFRRVWNWRVERVFRWFWCFDDWGYDLDLDWSDVWLFCSVVCCGFFCGGIVGEVGVDFIIFGWVCVGLICRFFEGFWELWRVYEERGVVLVWFVFFLCFVVVFLLVFVCYFVDLFCEFFCVVWWRWFKFFVGCDGRM